MSKPVFFTCGDSYINTNGIKSIRKSISTEDYGYPVVYVVHMDSGDTVRLDRYDSDRLDEILNLEGAR